MNTRELKKFFKEHLVPSKLYKYEVYQEKRNNYVNRIMQEKEKFNQTIQIILSRRKERLTLRNQQKIMRSKNAKAIFFALFQLLITIICIFPIAYLDYVSIRYLMQRFSGAKLSMDEFLKSNNFPSFLQYVLSIPVWVGLIYIGFAAMVKKIGKKAGKYAQSRWILMLTLSIVEMAATIIQMVV